MSPAASDRRDVAGLEAARDPFDPEAHALSGFQYLQAGEQRLTIVTTMPVFQPGKTVRLKLTAL